MRERIKPERIRVQTEENETVQSKLGEEHRQLLHEMVAAKKVEVHFEGRHPDTRVQNRFIGIKAYPKLFSKLFWKVQVRTGDGGHRRFEIAGEPADIEHQLWRLCEEIEEDFQRLQRAEALTRPRTAC